MISSLLKVRRVSDFNSFDGDNYLTRHLILNSETMNQDLRDLEFNFIELRKFNKQEAELNSLVEKWIYFIKNAGNLKMIPHSAEGIPELKEAYTQATMNTWSQEELDIYEYWQIRDAADRYGLEEKYDKGKAEGKAEGKIEIALKMRQKGMDVAEIMEMTGLSREEVERIPV